MFAMFTVFMYSFVARLNKIEVFSHVQCRCLHNCGMLLICKVSSRRTEDYGDVSL